MYNNNNYYQQPKNIGMPNYQQPMYQPIYQLPVSQPTNNGLLGKSVDSIEVVKAMDIPLDGSISYFPLTDGTAIVSKQLQADGTSKTVIYKPIQDKKETIKFATLDDIQEAIDNLDLSDIQDLRDDIKEIKKQLKEFKSKKSKDDEQ